ncbi:unnamed protein product, partial [Prorocentrum cordatum]
VTRPPLAPWARRRRGGRPTTRRHRPRTTVRGARRTTASGACCPRWCSWRTGSTSRRTWPGGSTRSWTTGSTSTAILCS